jgi:hypothetical protein
LCRPVDWTTEQPHCPFLIFSTRMECSCGNWRFFYEFHVLWLRYLNACYFSIFISTLLYSVLQRYQYKRINNSAFYSLWHDAAYSFKNPAHNTIKKPGTYITTQC